MKHFKKYLVFSLTFVIMAVLLFGCNFGSNEPTLKIDVERNMIAGKSYSYDVNLDGNGSTYELSLSKEGIVSIDEETHKIKALAEGKVVLTAKSDKNVKGTVLIKVGPALEYTIEYHLNGGEASDLVTSYNTLNEGITLGVPTKEGYNFAGWYTNAEYNGEVVTEIKAGEEGDKVFYAKWEKIIVNYKVTFDACGGKEVSEILFTELTEEFALPTTTKEGYNFLGWYENEERIEKVAQGTERNISVVAKWEAIKYTITYELNGGVLEGAVSEYTIEDEVVLVAPTKANYTFVGWYKGTEKVEKLEVGTTGDVTLTAKWEAEKYTITYELNGGVLEGAVSEYTVEDEVVLAVPTKAKYTFVGWYETADFSGEAITKIEAGTVGAKTFYAKWELAEVKLATPVISAELVGETLKVTFTAVENATGYTLYVYDGTEEVLKVENYVSGAEVTFNYNGTYQVKVQAIGNGKEVLDSDLSAAASITYTVKGIVVSEDRTGNYKTIKEAFDAAVDGDVINIKAGTYALEFVINKSVTFKGVDKDQVIIKVAAGVLGNVAASDITFDSVTLVGDGANEAGRYFQASAATQNFTVKNSNIKEFNTFAIFQVATTNKIVVTLENNKIERVGQFLFWVTAGMEKINFIGNTVESCGTIANTAAALFRVRSGSVYVYGNTFTGDVTAIAALFEAGVSGETFEVKYNTFKNVTKFVRDNGGNPVVFDKNVYLNADGTLLTEVPSTITGAGVSAGEAVSEEERAAAYEAFLELAHEEEYKALAKALDDAITALPTDLKYEDKATLAALRAKYNILPEAAKAKVTKLADLEAAEEKMETVEAEYVDSLIEGLPENPVLSDKEAVVSVRAIYEGLSETAKAKVTKLGVLESIEAKIKHLEETTVIEEFTVKYDLNGGFWTTRELMVADFLNDYNTINGITKKADEIYSAGTGPMKKMFSDKALLAKWTWLLEYLKSLSTHAEAIPQYEAYIAGNASGVSLPWALRQDIQGFLTQTRCAKYSGLAAINFSEPDKANGFWGYYKAASQKEFTYNKFLGELPTPYRSYYNFLGWYDEEGNKVTETNKTINLKANWEAIEYAIDYELNGGSSDKLVLSYTYDTDTFALVEPTKEGYLFLGWFTNPEFTGNAVTKIEKGSHGDMKLYASWRSNSSYDVEYVLNGGNWDYDSRQAVIDELFKDYNAYTNGSYTEENLPTGAWDLINFHTFFYSGTNSKKWAWLADYLGEVGSAANKPGCAALTKAADSVSFEKLNGNYKYEVSYEFRAFMLGTKMTSNSNYPTSDYSDPELANGFWDKLNATMETKFNYEENQVLTLPTPKKQYQIFKGWCKNSDLSDEPIYNITVTENLKLYAKFEDAVKVEKIEIVNGVSELVRYETLQLIWKITPSDASNQTVKFRSTNTDVLTVDTKGFVTAVTEGTAKIIIQSLADLTIVAELEITVYTPDRIDLSYDTTSYVEPDKSILINAEFIGRNGNDKELIWSSSDDTIATVEDGLVKGLKEGNVVITVKHSGTDHKAEINVNVIDTTKLSVIEKFALEQHNSNVFTRWNLGIGAGGPVYYKDIIGSVTKLLCSEELTINDTYLAKGNQTKATSGTMSSVEFITVHYTGNMSKGANAQRNAEYFTNAGNVSIHYTTGNDGIYHCLDNTKGAWHAGDSGGYDASWGTTTAAGAFKWTATGVKVQDGDPLFPEFTVTENAKYAINGRETTITIPDGTSAATKRSAVAGTGKRWINKQGLPFKVVNGEYYMGSTWWCYTQVAEGRICGLGGNRNSVGIESCVDLGSDLWYTWQKTAKLVAYLMEDLSLDITRVRGHHFFAAKDCPQPMLENNLEIWWEFLDLVEAEYEFRTTFKGYTVSLSSDSTIINNKGRVVNQPDFTTSVSYTLNFTKDGKTTSITLSTMVPGIYETTK